MTNNDTAKQQPEAPLTWSAKKEWGSVGMTHRADVTLDNGDRWSFVVDSPYKGLWIARGWQLTAQDAADGRTGSGDMKLYREDTTMKGAKAQAQHTRTWPRRPPVRSATASPDTSWTVAPAALPTRSARRASASSCGTKART